MKIVNISDIEDIVLAKYEIDTNNPDIDTRSNLNDFMNQYCSLTDAIIYDNNNIIPFKYIEAFNHKYLFVSENKDIDIITNLLTKIKYNFDNLKEMSNLVNSTNNLNFIMHNNKYYMLP